MVCIGESKRGKATKYKHVPDSLEPAIGHLFGNKDIYLGFEQMILYLVILLFELVVLERVLGYPLVLQAIEHEILKTAKQIDRSVVLAALAGLEESVKAVYILV